MKPHIYKRFGLWYCTTHSGWNGLGYTPAHAYSDWYGANRKVTLV